MWWYMPANLALWMLRQEDHKFETYMDCIKGPFLKREWGGDLSRGREMGKEKRPGARSQVELSTLLESSELFQQGVIYCTIHGHLPCI